MLHKGLRVQTSWGQVHHRSPALQGMPDRWVEGLSIFEQLAGTIKTWRAFPIWTGRKR
jgi:hypothetical protein